MELPAQQVLSELMARGVSDVVVAVVASPQSTVIGGATQTVRDLVAAWEQRDVMAREVAVDVASHSPQVDPILDELADVLAELTPMTPEVPVLLRDLVRPARAARVRCLVLGRTICVIRCVSPRPCRRRWRTATGSSRSWPRTPCSPTPSSRPRAGLGIPLAALAAMRREQELPHGLRGFLADLHSAGAAVDFSVLYPGGRLVDAPLPTWTSPSAAADPRTVRIPGRTALAPFRCIP